MRRWPLWTALALCALFAFERISDMDAGWLLALGREIARQLTPRCASCLRPFTASAPATGPPSAVRYA